MIITKALVLLFFSLLFSFNSIFGQDFYNSDLDGIFAGMSSLPDGWESVPASDPISSATILGLTDTPDLTGSDFPLPADGIIATPQSGFYCVSGDCGGNGLEFWHEGIQQTVGGLIPGAEYQISFYQAVVRTKYATHETGYWNVYSDNSLIGSTEYSTSTLNWTDNNVNWEFRTLIFMAVLDSHTFKFMPQDSETPRLIRMGIDNIHLTCITNVELIADTTICNGHSLILDATTPNGSYWWNTGETTPTIEITDENYYFVIVNNGCSSASDTVNIFLKECPVIVEMPNVFTPNGDGVNDFFEPIIVSEITTWKLTILDRWGVVVFESSDSNNFWDGTYKDKVCSDGVYYWILFAVDSFDEEHHLNGRSYLIGGN